MKITFALLFKDLTYHTKRFAQVSESAKHKTIRASAEIVRIFPRGNNLDDMKG